MQLDPLKLFIIFRREALLRYGIAGPLLSQPPMLRVLLLLEALAFLILFGHSCCKIALTRFWTSSYILRRRETEWKV
jgi:hypothetical protein